MRFLKNGSLQTPIAFIFALIGTGVTPLAAQQAAPNALSPQVPSHSSLRWTAAPAVTLDVQTMAVFEWLSDEPEPEVLLVELGFGKAEATAIVGLANAVIKGELAAFLATPDGMRLTDAFRPEDAMMAAWMDAIEDAIPNPDSDGGDDGTNLSPSRPSSGTPDPCGRPSGSLDQADSEAQLALLQEASAQREAGLKIISGEDLAGYIGGAVGSSVLGTALGRAGLVVGGPWTAAGGAAAGVVVGGAYGDAAGRAVYNRIFGDNPADIAQAAANVAEDADRLADNAAARATTALAEADAAEAAAVEAEQNFEAAADAAADALERAEQTGDADDIAAAEQAAQEANAALEAAQAARANADQKAQAAKAAAEAAAAAAELAAAAREAAKRAAEANPGLPGRADPQEVGASPFTDHVRNRMLEHNIRILSSIVDGSDPTVILLDPTADPSTTPISLPSASLSGEGLKLPLQPMIGSATEPCIDLDLTMAPEDGLSPTVVNPPIFGEPQADGPVGPPGNPLD